MTRAVVLELTAPAGVVLGGVLLVEAAALLAVAWYLLGRRVRRLEVTWRRASGRVVDLSWATLTGLVVLAVASAVTAVALVAAVAPGGGAS